MDKDREIGLKTKFVDFALAELVRSNRESFEPLWTVDSWAKFLIWIALNCGIAIENQGLESFAHSIGIPLSTRMRRIFFERIMDQLQLHVIADPADPEVLIMPLNTSNLIDKNDAFQALEALDLLNKVENDQKKWKVLDSLIAIPWQTLLS